MEKARPLPLDQDSFKTLYDLDIREHVQQMPGYGGNKIDYLEWATAWRLIRIHFPDAHYKVEEFIDPSQPGVKIPYLKTEVGFFVYVSVTIQTRTEMDMYALEEKTPTASDISDAHQRALVKALGRHGLGLKLWEKKEREKLHSKPAVSAIKKGPTKEDLEKQIVDNLALLGKEFNEETKHSFEATFDVFYEAWDLTHYQRALAAIEKKVKEAVSK